jgi:cyclic beta-1,2-glucan synthetase
VQIENPDGVCSGIRTALLDGVALIQGEALIPLVDDGKAHVVHIVLGRQDAGIAGQHESAA